MISVKSELIHSVYSPPLGGAEKSLKQIYSEECDIYEYSLARHALLAGLKLLGLDRGDRVLVPSFICRDVLAPFNVLGLDVIFYDLDESLRLIGSVDELPSARAILAVNYFGLETDLTPFLLYCQKHNAFLVEDNAHGLLSRSSDGKLLGTRGDVGIISARKSIPTENGALLLCRKGLPKIPQLDYLDLESTRLKIKNFLRPLVARWGVSFLLNLTRLKRHLRYLIKGSQYPQSGKQDELVIPLEPNPCRFGEYILGMNVESEIKRRRELYKFLDGFLEGQPIRALKRELGKNEAPYVYPFFCSPKMISEVEKKIGSLGLELVNWPALPSKFVAEGCPEFYKNLYLVKFLW